MVNVNKIIIDSIHNNNLLTDGFVIIDLLNEDEIELINQEISIICNQLNNQFSVTISHAHPLIRAEANNKVEKLIGNKFHSIFNNYAFLTGGMAVKNPGKNNEMRIHQDWNNTDESNHISVSMWVPLCNTDEHNGCIYVIPGSHKIRSFRGPLLPYSCAGINALGYKHFKPLPMKKGQALIYDLALIHRSSPNLSDQTRHAIIANFIPHDAPVVAYTASDKLGFADIYLSGSQFYLEYKFGDNKLPDWMTKISTVPISISEITPDLLIQKGLIS